MRPSALAAYCCLVLATSSYGVSTLLLAQGAQAAVRPWLSRAYRFGVLTQGLGFLLTFVARAALPLLVVQSTIACSVAVTAVGGVALNRWRLTGLDVAALVAVVTGVVATGSVTVPRAVTPHPGVPLVICAGVAAASLVLGRADRPRPVLAALAGLAFGGSAVAARVLARTVLAGSPWRIVTRPVDDLAVALLLGGLLAGQILLTRALTGPAVTGATAALYVAETAWPVAVEALWMGGAVRAGSWWLAAVGLTVALLGTVRLARPSLHAAPPADQVRTCPAVG